MTGSPSRQNAAFPWRWFALGVLIAGLIIAGGYSIARLADQPTPDAESPARRLKLGTIPPTRPTETSVPAFGAENASLNPTAPPPPTATSTQEPTSDNLATVNVPVADVRALPTTGAELVTQVLMGEKVRILDQEGDWFEIAAVEQPSPKHAQGYPGWMLADALSLRTPDTPLTAIVTALSAQVRSAPEQNAAVLHHLSLDSRLRVRSVDDSWVDVITPDGKAGWIAREQVHLVCTHQHCQGVDSVTPDPPRSLDDVLNTAMQFTGTPYLWGGASTGAFDCSGFVYRLFHANGITIPRDSRPMSETGAWVEREDLRPGDVVFLAESGGTGRVTHCSLYIGDGKMVTSVDASPISIISLDHPRYVQEYWGARRFPE